MSEAPFYGELLAGFPIVVVQEVAWGDMDSYGHVNNVVYFRYFENARLEYLRRLRWNELKAATGVGPILRDTQARFRLALTYPDTIAIGGRIAKVAEDRFFLEHRIVSRCLNAVATEGRGTVVSYNYRTGQKVPLPAEIQEGIRRLQGDEPLAGHESGSGCSADP
jgi:acyl-CoA thioester hydrolase